MTLAELEARVAHDLTCLNHGVADWVRPERHAEGHVFDVVVVGAGQSGLGAAFGLMRAGITNLVVLDENAEGFEGPWDTYARMVTLRTPKHLTAIDQGLPSLTFRAWWEAKEGRDAWVAIDKIPRRDWMDYLRWYRRILGLPVRNNLRLDGIEPVRRGLFRLVLASGEALFARKVVLATGIQGGGQWHVPPIVRDNLPSNLYTHTSEAIDYAAWQRRRIGILGGGASAFDNAQHALGQGVAEAHVFVRRRALPRVNPIRFMERSGLIRGFATLADDAKYRVMVSYFDRNQPPTNDTFARAAAWPGFALHLGAPWLAVEHVDGQARVTTPHGQHLLDFLVLSTGLVTDPALRPELRHVADGILRWGDRPAVRDAERHAMIDAHPYLGPGYELLPRAGADAATLHGLFAFNYSGLISLGLGAAALSGLQHALPRLVRSVADQLFLDGADAVIAEYLSYAEPEFVAETPSVAAVA